MMIGPLCTAKVTMVLLRVDWTKMSCVCSRLGGGADCCLRGRKGAAGTTVDDVIERTAGTVRIAAIEVRAIPARKGASIEPSMLASGGDGGGGATPRLERPGRILHTTKNPSSVVPAICNIEARLAWTPLVCSTAGCTLDQHLHLYFILFSIIAERPPNDFRVFVPISAPKLFNLLYECGREEREHRTPTQVTYIDGPAR